MKEDNNNENNQRIKLLLLLEVLRNQTSMDSPMSTFELCAWLKDRKVSCERRTLPHDIALLKAYGYPVETIKKGHSNAFYMDVKRLTVPEIKLLIDEIRSTSVLPAKESEELSEKLAELGGNAKEEILDSRISLSLRKHKNQEIYRTIMEIDKAIGLKKKVRFRYFDLSEVKRRVYRMNGEYYDASPFAMVPYEDNYYLVAYTEKHNGITMFRTDRISDIQVTDEDYDEKARRNRAYSNLETITTEAFKMYLGPMKKINLRFENSLIGSVYDHFGEDCDIRRVDGDTCEFYGQVQISPTLWGWIFQFGDRMEVVGPQRQRDEYISWLKKVLGNYEK